MEKQPSKKQKTEPKTILTTDTGEFDLTNILALAFGAGITD